MSQNSAISSVYSLILAGKRADDPLSRHFNLPNKALVNLSGKSLIQRVIETLQSSTFKNLIISLQSGQKQFFQEHLQKFTDLKHLDLQVMPLVYSPVDTIFKVLQMPKVQKGLLITTADNVLLSGEILNYLASYQKQTQADILIAAVNGQDSLIHKYPEVRR